MNVRTVSKQKDGAVRRRVRVMHIDDNRGDLTLTNEAFSSHPGVDYEGIDEAVTAIGKVAQDLVRGSPPSLIVLDLHLAGMDGMDILKLLNANRRLRRIPVVVLTSSDRAEERETCFGLGVRAFITKPTSFEGLCEATKSALLVLSSPAPPRAPLPENEPDEGTNGLESGVSRA